MAAMIERKACSSICQHAFDVFLSFRGADSRKNFTDHLYTDLTWAGIHTFRDDDEIKGGEHIGSKISKSIQESKMSLVVFSRDYASSKWCLEELLLIMKCRETIDHIVLPVFYEVDPDDVSMQTGFFAEEFRRLKILDLSHSHCLVTTPDFSGLQSLEILLLEGCISLVEVHYSIGNLKMLVFINLKDCEKLRKLPREMGELKSLQELNLSGCFNLEGMSEQWKKSSSEMVLHADGMSIKKLLAYVASLCSWLSSRKSLLSSTLTPLFLPDSLIKLTLSDCNLEDLDILDLSGLRSLEHLDLSGNPIRNLPESMNSLTMLKSLFLHRCTRLQSLPQLPESLMRLIASNYESSKIITNIQNLLGPLEVDAFNHRKLISGRGVFKLEPIRNFVVEMIKIVHLFNLAVGNIEVTSSNFVTSTQRKLSIQVFHDCGTSNIFLPGSDVPDWFYVLTERCQTTFYLPPSSRPKICGLNICVAYACINPEVVFDDPYYAKIRIETKRQIWEYTPAVFGFPEANEHMLWLCHRKFKDWFKAGDVVQFSVAMARCFQMKKCGILGMNSNLMMWNQTLEKQSREPLFGTELSLLEI